MPLRLTFGYDKEDLQRAQWDLIRLLQNYLSSNCSYSYFQAHQQLSELVNNLGKQDSPTAWVEAFGAELLRSITVLNAARCKETETALRRATDERDRLQRTLADIQQDPLQAQVQFLTEDRDRWLDQAAANGRRIEELETALQRAQTAHAGERHRLEQESARLQAEIAALNRIVAQQQLQLLDPLSDPENSTRKTRR
ncbi:MAG: hypothetical protein U9R05_02625 [Chloroflexota bacterium]|nr:hypothetical protein [Chloroflexota bacterium]